MNQSSPVEQLMNWLNQFPYVLTPKDVKEKATELLASEKKRDKQIAAKAWVDCHKGITGTLFTDEERKQKAEEYLKSLTK